jgi:hypothetical protein
MRMVFALLLMAVVAACARGQQLDSRESASDTAELPDSLSDEATVTSGQLDAAVGLICGPATRTSDNVECVRNVLLLGFDTTGAARDNCPSTSLDDVMECIVYGSLGYGLLQRAETPEATAFDWQAPVNSMHAVLDDIVDRNVKLCLGQYPSTAQSCYRLQIATSLGLSETEDTMCGSSDPEEWERCIWHAFVRSEFEKARLRM